MARRGKRTDWTPPSRRSRPPRPSVPLPDAPPASAFPPGTLRRVLVGGTLGAVALCALTAYLVLGRQASDRDRSADRALQAALTGSSCTTDTRADPVSSRTHVVRPTYAVDPPAGGSHTEAVAKAGDYAGAGLPADGLLVHALEHGYVVLWHRPGVAATELAGVRRAHAGDVVVAERASLPVPVAATAWGHRLLCERPEPRVLELFVRAHVGEGPEDVPRG